MRLLAFVLLFLSAASVCAADPETIPFHPHPQAGKFKLAHEPDHPLLSFYGGVGLRKQADGRWTGYAQTSPDDVHYLIDRCARNGMSRIYAAFQEEEYASRITPSPPAGSIDYIAMCIKLAHENNIEVYADQPCFAFVDSKNAALAMAHPEYFTQSVAGQADRRMFSAAYPQVRQYKRSIFLEWAENYPIDGLQLDYIRFPFYDYDYLNGTCPFGYDAPLLRGLTTRPATDDAKWIQTRADTVTQFIRELRADLRAGGMHLPVGVFNSSGYGARDSLRDVLQDWRTWENEGLVDQHCPMLLPNHGMTDLMNSVGTLRKLQQGKSMLVGPVFLDAFSTDPGDVPTPELVRDMARRLIKAGCDGLWFCRASEIEQFNLWPVVREISQWSIKQIRAENFDPAHENILYNHDSASSDPSWQIRHSDSDQTAGVTSPNDHGLIRVKLDTSRQTSIERSIHVRTLPYFSLNSLQTTGRIRGPGGDVSLEIQVQFADGKTDTLRHQLKPKAQWSNFDFTDAVPSDHAKHVAQHVIFRFILPRGEGPTNDGPSNDRVVEFDSLDVERDPLIWKEN